jgi:hypothetical protein
MTPSSVVEGIDVLRHVGQGQLAVPVDVLLDVVGEEVVH